MISIAPDSPVSKTLNVTMLALWCGSWAIAWVRHFRSRSPMPRNAGQHFLRFVATWLYVGAMWDQNIRKHHPWLPVVLFLWWGYCLLPDLKRSFAGIFGLAIPPGRE